MSQTLNFQTDIEPPIPPDLLQGGHWHLAAHSRELQPHKSLGVSVRDKPVVLYRKKDGDPVALEDRCPHRWAPLSGGRIDGDNIVCPYHGFKFCPRGNLVQTPGNSGSPGMNSAMAYPVMESESKIWIWLGDGAPTPAPVSNTAGVVPAESNTLKQGNPWV